MIEPQILENHGHVLCNVHAHIAVDLPSGFNLTRFRTRWKELTLGKGYLDRDPNGDFRVARKDIRRLAHYMAKQASWCPRPGSLPLAALGALLQALHGQQQRIDWCRPRVARTNERRRTFFLWSEQVAMVDQALAHASGVAESADASVALELIALDYLLGEKNGDSNAIARLLPRYERVLGVKLVLVEPSGSVVYGGATLESLRGSA
jgi:cysteine synthase